MGLFKLLLLFIKCTDSLTWNCSLLIFVFIQHYEAIPSSRIVILHVDLSFKPHNVFVRWNRGGFRFAQAHDNELRTILLWHCYRDLCFYQIFSKNLRNSLELRLHLFVFMLDLMTVSLQKSEVLPKTKTLL